MLVVVCGLFAMLVFDCCWRLLLLCSLTVLIGVCIYDTCCSMLFVWLWLSVFMILVVQCYVVWLWLNVAVDCCRFWCDYHWLLYTSLFGVVVFVLIAIDGHQLLFQSCFLLDAAERNAFFIFPNPCFWPQSFKSSFFFCHTAIIRYQLVAVHKTGTELMSNHQCAYHMFTRLAPK